MCRSPTPLLPSAAPLTSPKSDDSGSCGGGNHTSRRITGDAKPIKIMFGKLLGTAIRVATLPLDAVNAAVDLSIGGSGSKHSRTDGANPLGILEEIRDRVAETAEEIDKR